MYVDEQARDDDTCDIHENTLTGEACDEALREGVCSGGMYGCCIDGV